MDNTNTTKQILDVLNSKFQPLRREHLQEIFNGYIEAVISSIERARDPLFEEYQLGQQPWVVNYRNRKHIFFYNPTTTGITLTSNDGISMIVPTQSWVNCGLRPSTPLTASSGRLLIKFTDEAVP